MNTREDIERIKKHCHGLPNFINTPLTEWVHAVAEKLDEYAKLLDEKDKVIKRLTQLQDK